MKRLLRIIVKLIGLPFFLITFPFMYLMSLGFVFQEWLFENADRFYSHKEHHQDYLKGCKEYLKNIFK